MEINKRIIAGAFYAPALTGLLALFFVFTGSARAQVSEGFEAGGKTSYAAASVTLGSGSWYLDDALTGNLSGDVKTGAYAARVRNVGTVSMNFDAPSAGTFSVKHAVYGTDGSSSWELWDSTNGGNSWTKVGSTISTSSSSLTTAAFTINSASTVRFQIRKTAGGTNRIDFDGISISTYSGGGGGGGGTGCSTGSSSVHLTMGNPSCASTDIAFPANYLMVKTQYAESYNRDRGETNWTSWHLSSTDLGSTARQDDFRPDSTLPAGWYQVTGNDYSGSGYDRGHMCPSGDRTNSVANNSATFLMTNMIPQAPDNNQGPWASLEDYTRSLISSGANEAYIISGGYGNAGTVAGGHVIVPTYTWKVIMILPNGSSDVSRVTTSTRLIAIWMPNTQGIRNMDWRGYRVSVDYVEQQTGLDFFSNVAAGTQNVIESVIDNQ
jgi:endonuclease G, mitochondrial